MNFEFGKAFGEGMSAAKVTAELNAEIDQVFFEVSRQIFQATDNSVVIELERRSNGMVAIAQMFNVSGGSPLKQIEYIVARNVKLRRSEDLAIWERAPTAYPCKITYSDQTAFCSDKLSLEKKFLELLSHPETGKKMLRLLAPLVQGESGEG